MINSGGNKARRGWSHKGSETAEIEGRKHRPDYLIVVIAAILMALGLIVMYSISPAVSAISGEEANFYFTRHLISVAVGIAGFLIFYNIKLSLLSKTIYPLAVLAIVASATILVLDGLAFRWIKIAGFSFQPAELVKFGLVLWLAFFLSKQKRKGLVASFKDTLRPVLIVVSSIAFITVVLQRDLGSMVVLAAIMGIMLFIASVPMKPLILVFLALLMLGALAIASTQYRRDRFETFMNPERDCQNEGYHACQALIAIGSGGLFGLGVGNSVQAYGYLPETPTDSIFAIYAEKFGFVGSVILIGLLGALVQRMIRVASRTLSWEARLVMIGFITWFSAQSMINIGAMLGLLPLKGITLPLVSYGGSSLIFVLFALGVTLRISCYTSVRKNNIESKEQIETTSRTDRRGNRRTYHAPLSSR